MTATVRGLVRLCSLLSLFHLMQDGLSSILKDTFLLIKVCWQLSPLLLILLVLLLLHLLAFTLPSILFNDLP